MADNEVMFQMFLVHLSGMNRGELSEPFTEIQFRDYVKFRDKSSLPELKMDDATYELSKRRALEEGYFSISVSGDVMIDRRKLEKWSKQLSAQTGKSDRNDLRRFEEKVAEIYRNC